MPPIHISDPETDQLVRRLAARRTLGLTEAIGLAVRNELLKDDPEEISASLNGASKMDNQKALEHHLDGVIRIATLEYTRLRAKHKGTKGVGSRVYQMLGRHRTVETLRRLVDHPTDGLEFLSSIGRLDLSAEYIALKAEYESIIPEDIREMALRNLAAIKKE